MSTAKREPILLVSVIAGGAIVDRDWERALMELMRRVKELRAGYRSPSDWASGSRFLVRSLDPALPVYARVATMSMRATRGKGWSAETTSGGCRTGNP